MLPVFKQGYLCHMLPQSAVPQVTTLLLNVAGVAHVVDAALAIQKVCTDLNLSASDALNLNRTTWRAVTTGRYMTVIRRVCLFLWCQLLKHKYVEIDKA